MDTSRKQEIGVGILVIVATALLAYMSIKVGAIAGIGERIEIEVVLSDAAGLTQGAAVRVAGVQVGQVDTMTVDHNQARLAVSLSADAQIREDAKVQVRARSVLGEKYLEITPVSRDTSPIQSGAILTVTTPQTEIDELVNALGPLVTAIDADAMHAAMKNLGETLKSDPEQIARMLKNIDKIIDNGARASEGLQGLMSDTQATLSALRTISADARPIIQRTGRIMGRVDTATERLPEISADVSAMVSDARRMIQDSQGLMKRLERSTVNLEKVLENVADLDKWELRRLLREEGILVRFKEAEVKPNEAEGD
jgi:phospholipid/cholesterol/gamma-HCH transport system substrate-binding protein